MNDISDDLSTQKLNSKKADSVFPAQSSSSEIDSKIAQRYRQSRTKISKKTLVIIAVIAFVMALAFLIWAAAFPHEETIDTKTLSYETLDTQHSKITFQITNPRKKPVRCAIQALDNSHAIVGWKEIDYPARDTNVQQYTVQLRTEIASVSTSVKECWVISEN